MLDEAQLYILLDIAIAAVLGGVIGLEREFAQKPAGLQTNMIIAAATALIMSLARVLVTEFHDAFPENVIRVDPIRVLEAVVVGVGFIGAGTIWKSERHHRIHYLTTAATILMAAGTGVAVAAKQYVLAVGVALLVLVINSCVGWIESKKINTPKDRRNES